MSPVTEAMRSKPSLTVKDLGVNFLGGLATTSGYGFCGTPRRSASGEQRLHATCFEKPVFLPG